MFRPCLCPHPLIPRLPPSCPTGAPRAPHGPVSSRFPRVGHSRPDSVLLDHVLPALRTLKRGAVGRVWPLKRRPRGTCECDLVWKRGLSRRDRIRDVEVRSSWTRVALTQSLVLMRRGNWGAQVCTERGPVRRGKAVVRGRHRGMCPPARDGREPPEPGRGLDSLPQNRQKEPDVLTP